jgi:hypothetical protein
MYKVLKGNVNVSPPLLAPFATIAKWMKEIPLDKNEKNLSANLRILIDVFKPFSCELFYCEVSCLKQPLHPLVSASLVRLVNECPEFRRFCGNSPATKLLFLTPSADFVAGCWRLDWHELHEGSHLLAFMLILLPPAISKLVAACGDRELRLIVVSALNSVSIPIAFCKFLRFYLHSFPKSSLAECFALTSLSKQLPPFPALPRFHSMTYLDQCNLCDDSLGLLKTDLPQYYDAAVGIPEDAFFRWFIQAAEGSMMDFLFLRHSFASSFGCTSFLQCICLAPLQPIPSLLLSEDRKGLCIPNFLTGKYGIPHWPLTDQFQHFFPKFVLNGTIATTWHILASVIAENQDKVKIFLSAVAGKEQRKLVTRVLLRAEKAAASGCPDAGHEDRPFAFTLVQHLIDVSNNAVHAQPSGFAWI